MEKFNPHIKSLDVNVPVKKLEHILFIGFDFIIDESSTPYFLEANATPYGIQRYEKLYDLRLRQNIGQLFRSIRGPFGINIDSEKIKNLPSHKNRYKNTIYLERILKEESISYVTFEDKELEFYDEGYKTKEKKFNFLINREFGIPASFFRIGKRTWDSYRSISSIKTIFFLADKWKTLKAVKSTIHIPETYFINNLKEEKEAIEKITKKINKPFGVVIKPVDGTGGEDVQFLNSHRELKKHNFPSLIQERIHPKLYNGKIIDYRIFFINGWISKAIGRTAPADYGSKSYPKEKFLTSLSSGGNPISISGDASSILKDYVRMVANKLDETLSSYDVL